MHVCVTVRVCLCVFSVRSVCVCVCGMFEKNLDPKRLFLPPCSQSWNVLALDGSNWQRIDLFDFQRDIEVSKSDRHPLYSYL